MSILERNIKLEELESQLKWQATIEFCKSKWLDQKNSLNRYLRYYSQLWFLMNYYDDLPPFDKLIPTENNREQHITSIQLFHSDNLFEMLREIYQYGENHFSVEPEYQCLSGFMMQETPLLFAMAGISDYDSVEEDGKKRLNSEFVRNNFLCKILSSAIIHSKPLTETILDDMFPGKSAFDEDVKYRLLHL